MSRNCQDLRQLLEQLLDGDIDLESSPNLAAHLQECPACRREVAQERTLHEAFGSLPELSCPERITSRVEEATTGRIGATSRARHTRFPHWLSGWRPIAAVAAAALAFVLLTTRPQGPPEPPGESRYTSAEIETARRQLQTTLRYTLAVIHSSQREAIGGVFGERLPQAIKGSLRKTWERTQGGQG